MTFERLENYCVLAEQKNLIEAKYMPSSVSAVDTAKPLVQSNTVAKTTENLALQRLAINPFIKKEYHRVCAELIEMEDFIDNIPDEVIRAMAIRRFIFRQSYRKIGFDLHYSKSATYEKLTEYIAKKGQQTQYSP